MNVWQISAGSNQRDYSKAFLDYGMAFVGGSKQIETLSKVEEGDYLVLKDGLKQIQAVGQVVKREGRCFGIGDKAWLKDFDGWNLEAYVNVDWRSVKMPVGGLRMGTISRLKCDGIEALIEKAMREGKTVDITRCEPAETASVDDEALISRLICDGLSPRTADELTDAFRRIRRLALFYKTECRSVDVREHEIRTFLVVPLLLALGWSEQQMKIELSAGRGRIDLACFRRPYRADEEGNYNASDCALIVETKAFSQGLSLARDQAIEYCEHYQSADIIAITNGYCYKVFKKDGNAFPEIPFAYMNLLDLRDRYPIDPERTSGAIDLISSLRPAF